MEIVIFITLISVVWFTKSFYLEVKYIDRQTFYTWVVLKLVYRLGLMFVYPLILIWFISFLFNYSLGYWQSFMVLLVLEAFTIRLNKSNKEDLKWLNKNYPRSTFIY